tara:strand:+ start:2529 stop:3014 length:486 start_codon:yes stop_codon:yes gene_type:complete
MAANKATVSISASVLPDDIKSSVRGSVVYDLNDIGNNNKWVYFANNVSNTAQSIIPDGVTYISSVAGDESSALTNANDDVGFLVLKHTGYQGDGTTTSTDNLYLNLTDSVDASGNPGNLILEPGDVWWGRFLHSDVDDISVKAAANTIKLLVYAVCDDGGV